jgi:dihydrofolate reductase
MHKSIIVAMSANHAIGKDNQLLWHIPEDLKRFKEITNGHHVIMGRKTFESIGRVLPGRQNIILTNDPNYVPADGAIVAKSIDVAFDIAEKNGETEAFIIGGGEIYFQTIDIVDTIYLTKLLDNFDGDSFFPPIDFGNWTVRDNEIQRYMFNGFEGKYNYENITLDRKI